MDNDKNQPTPDEGEILQRGIVSDLAMKAAEGVALGAGTVVGKAAGQAALDKIKAPKAPPPPASPDDLLPDT